MCLKKCNKQKGYWRLENSIPEILACPDTNWVHESLSFIFLPESEVSKQRGVSVSRNRAIDHTFHWATRTRIARRPEKLENGEPFLPRNRAFPTQVFRELGGMHIPYYTEIGEPSLALWSIELLRSFFRHTCECGTQFSVRQWIKYQTARRKGMEWNFIAYRILRSRRTNNRFRFSVLPCAQSIHPRGTFAEQIEIYRRSSI